MITLRELCEILGITRRTIQCYEQVGLLKPCSRNKYGHLLYDEGMVGRVERIRFLSEIGFPLKDIGEILDAPPKEFCEALSTKVEELERKNERQKRLIREAKEMIKELK